jgi:glycosyltransferase involved in cell wall biosynthesis
MAPELSVVVPTYNRQHFLPGLVAALDAQDLPKERFEVIVVDNASPDGTWAYLTSLSHPWLRPVHEKTPGAAAARNRGWREARGEIVLFMDDDMAPAPDCLRQHLEAHRRRPKASYLGFVDYRYDTWTHPLSLWVAERTEGSLFPAAAGEEASFYQYLTQNVSSPRAAVEEVGGFDPGFRGYGFEDPELGYKLHRAGLPLVYLPEATALNRDPHRPEVHWKKTACIGEGQAFFLSLHPELESLDSRRYLSGRLGPVWSLYRTLLGEVLDRAAEKAPPEKPLPRWVKVHYRVSQAAFLHRGFTAFFRQGGRIVRKHDL